MAPDVIDGPPALANAHALAVPHDVEPALIESLALARFPAARWGEDGDLHLTRHSRVARPAGLPRWVAREVGIPDQCTWVYRVLTDVQRGDPPARLVLDPSGLVEAFPQGAPILEEQRVVDWALATARRTGGALHIAPAGPTLTPQPSDVCEAWVYSEVWLTPEAGERVCQEVFPSMHLALPAHEWTPPPIPAAPLGPGVDLDAADLHALHGQANRLDAEAAAMGPTLIGYAVELNARERGVVAVEIGPCDEVPLPVARKPWDVEALTSYRVRWSPVEEAFALHPHPDAAVRRQREWALNAVTRLAVAIAAATGGMHLDGDGFVVSP